jgi:hypothetical protein
VRVPVRMFCELMRMLKSLFGPLTLILSARDPTLAPA